MMATRQLLAFLLFAVAAAGTPGPSNAMLAAVGAQAGVLRGLPALFGVMAGMGLMMFAVPLGLGNLVLRQPLLLSALKAAGAAYLLWLSWIIARSSGGPIEAHAEKRPLGFLGAAGFQWVNPKSWLVSGAAGTAFLSAGARSALAQAAVLGGLFVLAALPSCFLWLAFGAAVPRVLRTARRIRVFNIAMAALLALSIVLILR